MLPLITPGAGLTADAGAAHITATAAGVAGILGSFPFDPRNAVTLRLRGAAARMLCRDQAPELRPLAISSATGGVVT